MKLWRTIQSFFAREPYPIFTLIPTENSYTCKPFVNPMKTEHIGSGNDIYKALKTDDLSALSNIISTSKTKIGIQATMDLFAIYDSHPLVRTAQWGNELNFSTDPTHAEYLSSAIAGTDWFSAAVHLNATKCIAWAISEKWGSATRAISRFHTNKSHYPTNNPDNLRTTAMSGTSIPWRDLAKKDIDGWTKLKWSTHEVGTTEWLKRLIFEIHKHQIGENKLNETSYDSWDNQCPNKMILNDRLDDSVTALMTLVYNFNEIGVCDYKTWLGIKDWMQPKETQSDYVHNKFAEIFQNIEKEYLIQKISINTQKLKPTLNAL